MELGALRALVLTPPATTPCRSWQRHRPSCAFYESARKEYKYFN